MFCIYCGEKIEDDGLEVCPNCGNSIYKETPVTNEIPVTAVNEKEKQIDIGEMRVISGSDEMLRRIPLKSPRII
ncbi:hypothetical protein [Anaerovorax odorimutans]|uniref:hypothetical protein n=1 Tax=Anaerovorax odorimutans TaxID=109327 RepID=UPI0004000E01|nr:hypothetical protein [Anaerovorax odorimutans]